MLEVKNSALYCKYKLQTNIHLKDITMLHVDSSLILGFDCIKNVYFYDLAAFQQDRKSTELMYKYRELNAEDQATVYGPNEVQVMQYRQYIIFVGKHIGTLTVFLNDNALRGYMFDIETNGGADAEFEIFESVEDFIKKF
jgi:hypothetical protein